MRFDNYFIFLLIVLAVEFLLALFIVIGSIFPIFRFFVGMFGCFIGIWIIRELEIRLYLSSL